MKALRAFPSQPDDQDHLAALPRTVAEWFRLGGTETRAEWAHHMRNAVTAVLGWAEILLDDEAVPPQRARQVEAIHQSAVEL